MSHWKRCSSKNSVVRVSSAGVLCVFVCLLLQACSHSSYNVHPESVGYTRSGKASYYAMKFQFRTTASGERFNNYAMTAAHRTLPFGTKVRVVNLRNNAAVVVRINDRGPFVKGRIIDLSRAAFDTIANLDSGVIDVRIEVVE